jgi:hypothetical protein
MKKLYAILIIIFMLLSCGGPGDDSCGNTVPTITDVVFFTCDSPDFNPEHDNTFNVSDEFDVIIYTRDCGLDMETLYSSLGIYDLPDQIDVYRAYHFESCFIMNISVGFYTFEFQIEDSEGHLSNIYGVDIEVK